MFVYEEAELNDKLHDKMRLQVEWYGMKDKTFESHVFQLREYNIT